ncbi:MAG TPA: ribosome recycling factor, partial [Deltaproteobacteria bacterium]|nr:ribosome recycling factor [Deltaproteobacteria bacterium]
MTLENTQEVEEMVNHKMDLTIENLKQDLSGI